MSILGVYKSTEFSKSLRVGTPDPTKYHDARTVHLEGANGSSLTGRMPGNDKFTLCGVIIPRATADGASRGNDHERPMKVFIDPEFTNGNVVVDLQKMRDNPEQVVAAINSARHQHDDRGDAIIEAFGQFADDVGRKSTGNIVTIQPKQPEIIEEPRRDPLPGLNSYVVPKSTPGGRQVQPAVPKQPAPVVKSASLVKQASIPTPDDPAPDFTPRVPAGYTPPASPPPAYRSIQSLRDELEDRPKTMAPRQMVQELRRVVFELPMPGSVKKSLGKFEALYHEVVKADGKLILIYDHATPTQNVWFPPEMEDPETQEPLAIAMLLVGGAGESDRVFRVYPTGIMFRRGTEEFCVLTYDLEKERGQSEGQ